MMLQPITAATVGDARLLLKEGFPNRPADFWDGALSRLMQYAGNRQAGVPIGYLMTIKDVPQGVILTPAKPSSKPLASGSNRIVNLSSWYVRPEHRWCAVKMLQSVLALDNTAFTDFTPTEPVQKMLTAFGFKIVREGISVIPLPLARLRSKAGSLVTDLSTGDLADLDRDVKTLLHSHAAYGCVAGVLEAEGERLPIAFKVRKFKGIRCAHLVFCEKNQVVYRNLAAIAQYLIEKGVYILLIDVPPGQKIPGIVRRRRDRKFARGLNFAEWTDYLGSELSVFDW